MESPTNIARWSEFATVKIIDRRLKDFAVYCFLCRRMNRESNVAFPSRRDIANGCGIRKEETVDKAIKSLLEKGLIEKYHRRFIDRREMNVELRYRTSNF